MTSYKCFTCGKEVKSEYLKKKVRCLYCGSKVLYKSSTVATTLKAV